MNLASKRVLPALVLLTLSGCVSAELDAQDDRQTQGEVGQAFTASDYGTTIVHAPATLPSGPMPLVVAIHGCTQSAAIYEKDTGWNQLADKYGFVVIYPYKTASDLQQGCWSHGNTGTKSPTNDAAWIISEINRVKGLFSIDPKRVYVTGLSSGGGMAYCVVELNPTVFAAAAPMAGPQCNGSGTPNQLPVGFPILIWNGTSDFIVNQSAAQANFDRYGAAFGGATKTITNGKLKASDANETYAAYTKNGKEVVGLLLNTNMSHGISVDPGTAEDQGGTADTYAFDTNIHSSYYSAKFFGLLAPSSPPPTVSITSPANGASFDKTVTAVTIQVQAADAQSVKKIDISIDGVLQTSIAESSSPNQTVTASWTWDVSAVSSGVHSVSAKATNASGGTATSTISITAGARSDTTSPTVAITSPASGATVNGTVAVAITAADNTAVTKVEVSIDGTLAATLTSSPYQFSWNTKALANGSHTVAAKAFDAAGNTASDSKTYTVSNSQVQATATDTCTNHYLAGRIDVNGYIGCGQRHGYIAKVTYYQVNGVWTDVAP
jgi:poly(3-hydroxybutyrate) depolymerase